MRKIKEVLRLKYEANLSSRQIAASLKLSVGVISKYTQAAEVAGVSWPLPDGLDDATLEERLFPLATPGRDSKSDPSPEPIRHGVDEMDK